MLNRSGEVLGLRRTLLGRSRVSLRSSEVLCLRRTLLCRSCLTLRSSEVLGLRRTLLCRSCLTLRGGEVLRCRSRDGSRRSVRCRDMDVTLIAHDRSSLLGERCRCVRRRAERVECSRLNRSERSYACRVTHR